MREERVYPADRACLPDLMAFLEAVAERADLPVKRAMQLQLAVEEAVVNLCEHAYAGTTGEFRLRIEREGDRLVLELRDAGPAFDPLSLPEPDTQAPMDARRPGGLGVSLMRRMVDDLAYRREGGENVLTMRLGTGR